MREVTVSDMASSRERRAERQRDFLTRYNRPLISFMLNIPGAIKRGDLFDSAFDEGVRRIEQLLREADFFVAERAVFQEFTGNEFYAVIGESNSAKKKENSPSAEEIKRLLMKAEEADSLGRLFDIDVLRADGRKVSRGDIGAAERRCLLCENDAHACARSRSHSVAELLSAITATISAWKSSQPVAQI